MRLKVIEKRLVVDFSILREKLVVFIPKIPSHCCPDYRVICDLV
jgi:hypothetical protein